MKRNWVTMIVLAGGLEAAAFAQQYPQQQYPPQYQQQYPQQQNGPYQGNQNDYGQQYGNGQYPDNGQYAGGQGYAQDNGDSGYYGNQEGVYAPAPPPMPSYAYQRPIYPGEGYNWVDGYWNFVGRRYVWVGGYWARPPYNGGYWVAPRYSSGRFFLGFWGGGRSSFYRGSVGNGYRYQGRYESPRYSYRAPVQGRYESRGGGSGRYGYRR